MAVNSVYVREIAQGDGQNTIFGFPWKFVAASDILVYVDDVLQPASAYEISNPITKDSGFVKFNTAPEVGAIVVIRRADNMQQARLFKNQENFNAHEVEKGFDKLTLLVQEGFEELHRGTLRMESQSNLDYTIESLGIDDSLLALDLDNKRFIQTSFTQEQVQTVIDNAVRSTDLTVKNQRWDGNILTISFDNNSVYKGVVSGNVAQLRARHDDNGDWWLEWSLDGQTWRNLDCGTGISSHNLLTERDAPDAHPISAISGLQTVLSAKADSDDVYTKTDVDTALSTKATKATDFMTAITNTNKGATKNEIDALDVKIGIKADNNLLNITDEAKNISNWSSNVSNCITNIPQDIKLELNNGTLTLKTGSKVYKPNGVGVFDEFIINADKSFSGTDSSTYQALVFYDGSTTITICPLSGCASGASLPSSFSGVFYNTITNKINSYASSVKLGPDYYLPVGIITMSGASGITSIDQVFNGFGYIGSTIFALPGVKGLIPNGRNEDGSLKNIPVALNNVSINTIIGGLSDITVEMLLKLRNGVLELKSTESKTIYYNVNDNHVVRNGVITTEIMCGNVLLGSNAKITNSTLKTVFNALDYNNSEYIAHQAMPSNKYVDLTLSAGTPYTAPADGYFTIRGSATAVNGYVMLSNEAKQMINNPISTIAGGGLSAFLPVEKGDVVNVWYNNYSNTTFRFIYANGAQ